MKSLRFILHAVIGRDHPDAKAFPALASIAPHVRGAVNQMRLSQWRILPLAVVMLAAVFNVGQQYVQAGGAPILGVAGAGLGAFAVAGLAHIVPIFIVAYVSGAVWEGLFAYARGRAREPGMLVTALLFTCLMPPAASLWHVALGMSFAIVFAQEVFGGHGKTFLPPALVGVAVLQVSFPSALAGHPIWSMIAGYSGTTAFSIFAADGQAGFLSHAIDAFGALMGNVQGAIGTSGVLACLFAAVIMVWRGAANWRAMAGVVLGVVIITWMSGWQLGWYWHLALGGTAFGAVFLVTDPAGSASTNAGRWGQGILAGGLVVLIRVYNPGHPDGLVPAFLFAAIMAPLLDWFAVRWQVRRARIHALRRRARL